MIRTSGEFAWVQRMIPPINTGLPSFCASVVGFFNTSRFIELNNTAIDGAQRNRVSGAYIIF